MSKRHQILTVLALMVLAASVRFVGFTWGYDGGHWYQPDEGQHVGIALNELNRRVPEHVPDAMQTYQWNARGFGHEIAALAPLVCNRNWQRERIAYIGRGLSLAYGVGTVLFVYVLVLACFKSPMAATLAAGLLAVADLHVTYSHYAVPEAAHVFWMTAAMALLACYATGKRSIWIRLLIAAALGQCVALKLDPTPAATFVLLALLSRQPWKLRLLDCALVGLLAVGTLCWAWGTASPQVLIACIQDIARENMDTVDAGNPLLYNPILYLSSVVAGTSFPMVICAFAGFVLLLRRQLRGRRQVAIAILLPPLFCLAIYLTGDVTLVRRAIILLPLLAICAGIGITAIPSRRLRLYVAIGVPVYTAALMLISQCAFLNDTRDMARAFMTATVNPAPAPVIAYSQYVPPLLPPPAESRVMHWRQLKKPSDYADVDYIVMHETYFSRYGKSFTTPFHRPTRLEQVYHGHAQVFPVMRDLLDGNGPFVLWKTFDHRHPFPERVLFKRVYGTYESFLGETRIYRRATLTFAAYGQGSTLDIDKTRC